MHCSHGWVHALMNAPRGQGQSKCLSSLYMIVLGTLLTGPKNRNVTIIYWPKALGLWLPLDKMFVCALNLALSTKELMKLHKVSIISTPGRPGLRRVWLHGVRGLCPGNANSRGLGASGKRSKRGGRGGVRRANKNSEHLGSAQNRKSRGSEAGEVES